RLATGRLDTPQHVVNVALKALDSGNRKGSVIVGGVNAVMAFATRFVSRKAVVKMASKVMKANH
ncbi:MAG: hypothetical protein RL670_1209, partial [Actinomycetota bacterium]